MSTVQRHLGSFAQFVGCSDLNFEELLATSADESKSDFDILWEIFFRGIDCSSTGPDLCVTEAKRFFGYVKLLKPYFETKDLHGLAAKLEELDIPQTDVTRDAIQRLRTSNDNSHEAMALALAPIMLTNVLYLIACRDVDNEVLVKLCPLYEQDRAKWKLPSARWLDAIRQDKGISSDEKLGSLLLPGPSLDSAKRQILRWRKGEELPSWQWVETASKSFPEDTSQNLYWALGTIRILHGLFDEAGQLENMQSGFSSRGLFETSPQLQELAKERMAMFSAGSAERLERDVPSAS